MTEHVDRIPPLELTLGDALRIAAGKERRWCHVVGLVLAGDQVVVTCAGLEHALVLPAQVPVVVLREEVDADDAEVEAAMAGWYSGDMDSVGLAAALRASTPSSVRRGPVPSGAGLSRDPSLVGIYGGDLDHIRDALGGDPDRAARDLRAATERSLAATRDQVAPQPGEPETDEITAAVEARMAGWYAGDVDYVVEHNLDHPDEAANGTAPQAGR